MAHPVSNLDLSYVVERPRVSDAVGCALRDVYIRQPLPDDMLALLAKLNDQGWSPART